MIVFQPLFINDVYNLFPSSIANKLIKCDGDADEHFENVLGKISKLRAETQKLQLAREAKKPISEPKKEEQPQGGGGGGRRQGYFGYGGRGRRQGNNCGNQVNLDMKDPPNLVTHSPPIRDENCRICNTLEATGDTKQLYDGHVSNYPTGCPWYIGLSVNRRYQLALEAKLCIACHHPDYIFKRNDKDHKCSVVNSKKKGRFTCQTNNCFVHLWVCTRHKNSNMKLLEKFQEEVKTKYNLDFGFVVNIPIHASDTVVATTKPGSLVKITSSAGKNVDDKFTSLVKMEVAILPAQPVKMEILKLPVQLVNLEMVNLPVQLILLLPAITRGGSQCLQTRP